MRRSAPMPAERVLNDVELCAWISQAEPGQWLEYHRGFLVIDAMAGISTLAESARVQLAGLGRAAHRAFEAGLVHLVQVRLGPERFAYIAIARPKPKASAASLPALLLAEQGQTPDVTGSSGRAAA